MTAKGTFHHYECDQCHQRIRVDSRPPAPPIGSPLLFVDIDGGSRLDKIEHLCPSCRNKLDTHFFGPIGCDGPDLVKAKELLKRVLPALRGDKSNDGVEFLILDVEVFLDPDRMVAVSVDD